MERRVNGAAVRALRVALGIRQDALASRVGITKSALSHIERGANGARPEVIRKLADEMCVGVDAITHAVPVPA